MMTVASKAEALFVSALQPSENPQPAQVIAAIKVELERRGGCRGCAAECAAEFGHHPEAAISRMRWALAKVA